MTETLLLFPGKSPSPAHPFNRFILKNTVCFCFFLKSALRRAADTRGEHHRQPRPGSGSGAKAPITRSPRAAWRLLTRVQQGFPHAQAPTAPSPPVPARGGAAVPERREPSSRCLRNSRPLGLRSAEHAARLTSGYLPRAHDRGAALSLGPGGVARGSESAPRRGPRDLTRAAPRRAGGAQASSASRRGGAQPPPPLPWAGGARGCPRSEGRSPRSRPWACAGSEAPSLGFTQRQAGGGTRSPLTRKHNLTFPPPGTRKRKQGRLRQRAVVSVYLAGPGRVCPAGAARVGKGLAGSSGLRRAARKSCRRTLPISGMAAAASPAV